VTTSHSLIGCEICHNSLCEQDEVSSRLIERMEDCTRSFPRVLVLGGSGIHMLTALRNRGSVETAVLVDSSPGMLKRAKMRWQSILADCGESGSSASLHAEFLLTDASSETLPLEPTSFDGTLPYVGVYLL